MTIKNALKFIDLGIRDAGLRDRLNAANNIADRDEVLATLNLAFSDHDFEEAFHHRLTLCQAHEEADLVKEFKMWWDLLTQIISLGLCGHHCNSCSS